MPKSRIDTVRPTGALHYEDATTLAALIAAGQVSSREVVQAHLDRIREVNPQINAIVTLLADDALHAADTADAAVRAGTALGPLHGVPFTVKDCLDTAGLLTQSGSTIFAGNVPEHDATAVARIKAAGGILLAKTNVPEFSSSTETDNHVTVDPEITAAVTDAATRLGQLGCRVTQVDAAFLTETDAPAALTTLVYGELVPYITTLAAGREDVLSAAVSGILTVPNPTLGDIGDARRATQTLRSAFSSYFSDFDVLLCPVNPVTAPLHGSQEFTVDGVTVPWTHVMAATSPFNLTGLPALSVPYAISTEGLPINIQLVGAWFDESTILRLGALLERSGGLGSRRPSLPA